MNREQHAMRLTVAVGLTLATVAFSVTANAQEATDERLVLTEPLSELRLPEEPARHYAWPTAVMGVATAGIGVGGLYVATKGFRGLFCFDCEPNPREVIPLALAGALFTAGLTWLIVRVVQFRRAHRAFEEESPRLVW